MERDKNKFWLLDAMNWFKIEMNRQERVDAENQNRKVK